MDEKRLASILRSRQWHEQRTAAGKCHRCQGPTQHWYCRRCAILISEQKQFAGFVNLVASNKCVECRQLHQGSGLTCRRCKQRKVLNSAYPLMRRSSVSVPRSAMEGLRPIPLFES